MRVGIDIVSVKKIEGIVSRWGERFLRRIYSKDELYMAEKRTGNAYYQHLAGRFAVKEAIIKVLDSPVPFCEISVINDKSGAPIVVYPEADLEVSISHTEEYAVAVCVKG